jgi:hypothetical protein
MSLSLTDVVHGAHLPQGFAVEVLWHLDTLVVFKDGEKCFYFTRRDIDNSPDPVATLNKLLTEKAEKT